MTHVSVLLGCHLRCEQQLIQKSQQHQEIESHVCEPGGDKWDWLEWFFRFLLLFTIGDPGVSRIETSLLRSEFISADFSITLLKFLRIANKKKEISFLFVHQQFLPENKNRNKSFFFRTFVHRHTRTSRVRAHTIVVETLLAFAQWPFANCFSMPFWWKLFTEFLYPFKPFICGFGSTAISETLFLRHAIFATLLYVEHSDLTEAHNWLLTVDQISRSICETNERDREREGARKKS